MTARKKSAATTQHSKPRQPSADAPQDASAPELTAKPKTMPQEFGQLEREDQEGLAVAPEQLGTRFLEDAVEEGDQVPSLDERAELDVNASSRNDAAMPGPNFEANQDVWENTVNLAGQDGVDEALAEVAPAPAAVELEMTDDDETIDLSAEERDLDMRDSSIREASLFDHEGDELGEVEEPEIDTEDTHSHGRPRGGHTRRSGKGRPSA